LQGARLVTASEGERGQRLAESLIKRLSGGDKITARFLHHEFFEFIPTFKIWLSTNHKPVIRGGDNAIWNRIHLIPFDVSIPKSEQIPRTVLLERLREEWPGILAWAVKGCLLWQQEGLNNPEEVEQATANFRAEMDVIGGFISDCCIMNPLAKVKAADLYCEYQQWCEANREEAVNKRILTSMLQERGCTQAKVGRQSARGWQGIGLRSNADMRTNADAFFTIAHETKYEAEKSKKSRPRTSACPQMDFEEGDI
jgi:putative DNA primase/helicase